jgi:hypothetical protein
MMVILPRIFLLTVNLSRSILLQFNRGNIGKCNIFCICGKNLKNTILLQLLPIITTTFNNDTIFTEILLQ